MKKWCENPPKRIESSWSKKSSTARTAKCNKRLVEMTGESSLPGKFKNAPSAERAPEHRKQQH